MLGTVAGIVLLGLTGGGGFTPERGSLRVELCDGTALSPSDRIEAMAEASRIFEGAGVAIEWGDGCGEAPRVEPFVARIYVLKDLPKPIRYALLHRHDKARLMGYTLAAPGGEPGPVLYVARERVATQIGGEETRGFARALGRVFAHELAHRFLRSGHTNGGLLRERFTREDLIGDEADLEFSAEQRLRLHALASKAVADRDGKVLPFASALERRPPVQNDR